MKKVILIFVIVTALSSFGSVSETSKDSLLLNENFESGTFPPDGWTLENKYPEVSDGGFNYGIYGVNLGDISDIWNGNQAFHNFIYGDQDDWLITPKILVPLANATFISFMQHTTYLSYYEYHGVCVSADKINWTEIYTGFPAEDPLNPDCSVWQNTILDLSSYKGQEIYIGFNYRGFYADSWHIDDVKIVYDENGPEIISVSGNPDLMPVIGAYVSNPIFIKLEVYDISDVSSITGHYNISSSSGDIIFTRTKNTSVWTGSVPAMNDPASGTIYFDMMDIGGISSVSQNYEIQFFPDSLVPVINYCTGLTTFIDLPMNIEIAFEDESTIAQVTGHYSKDSWATQYDFELSPSKANEYLYTGTIPAESHETPDGEVKFTITDSSDNTLVSKVYNARWYDGTHIQVETFDEFFDPADWSFSGSWGLESSEYISSPNSLTESPDGDYTQNNSSAAVWEKSFDLPSFDYAFVSFWCKYEIELDFDYIYLELSDDNGSTWTRLKTWTGSNTEWHIEECDLSRYIGISGLNLRWLFKSDGGIEMNGMNIDDVYLSGYYNFNTPPYIFHDGPEFLEGSLYAYESSYSLLDINGINSTWVEYKISFSDTVFTVQPQYSEPNFFNFSIPAYPAGTRIDYTIIAVDASEDHLERRAGPFSYIAGYHDIYDCGIVSYYLPVNTGNAVAVRLDESYDLWYLAGILIRNFADAGHSSAVMKVHIWLDDSGVPGEDIISPFDVSPEADIDDPLAFTYIGESSFGPVSVQGTYWIGFSAPYGTVYTTEESVYEPDVTAYERSFAGSWNGSGWSWIPQPQYNYHIRAVYGLDNGINSENSTPASCVLYQNYPNPFNHETRIRFELNADQYIRLAVYNIQGEFVSVVADGKFLKGSHKVSFNGNNLNSGIYFCRLEIDGEIKASKRMLLLK
ncbi:MAG TPA: choice-of-anchor J domain-containing protein [Clostridiales bacterium]|nr:choice-of-anchor J domain-containing protein [Clostridiales bacterium]HQP69486.1 choice-of-anchor J domain-containing protein [Clostridiales bacterium]